MAPPENAWIIPIWGQSNASGQGALPPSGVIGPSIHADRVSTFTQGGQWWQAFEPMHSHSATYGGAIYSALNSSPVGAGPGLFFAQKLADLIPGIEIVMAPVAKGGAKMTDHAPSTSTATVFGAGTALISQASVAGKVKAGLFIQGEGDTILLADANAWGSRFAAWVAAQRAIYGDDLIIIFAQLGTNPGATRPYWDVVKAQQAAVSIPGVYMITTDDLAKQADGVHYTTASLQTLGERMAVKYREVLSTLPGETF